VLRHLKRKPLIGPSVDNLSPGRLKVATCQFPVSGRIGRNASRIRRMIAEAARRRADVVHFPEAALSGYAGVDLQSWEGYDWDLLREETLDIIDLAKEKEIWVLLGSAHPLSKGHLPHNCLYSISPEGSIVERYDKRFCTEGDLKFYSPGTHLSMVEINGVRCGMLICYDVRFPEIYREYKKLGAQMIFHSFYNARAKRPGIHKIIMRPSVQTRAATNYLWLSVSNSSAHSSWPSVFVQPDGTIAGQLRCDRPGIMVNTVDTDKKLYDASRHHRELAMQGVLNTGRPVRDPRSENRTCL